MCLNGYEMLFRCGGIIGVNTNGGFAEYIVASEGNTLKISDDVESDVAASLATTTITPLSCVKRSLTKIK
jgi:D-arabinose 1-dehydrogenase-like Zn-dependent alcohol dehydrogenase